MTKKNPRKEFSPYKEAIQLFNTLKTEQLNNPDELDKLLLKHKLDIGPTAAGRARAAVLRERGYGKEEKPSSLNGTENRLMIVTKTAKQVGGLENLKKIVNLLEKLKGI